MHIIDLIGTFMLLSAAVPSKPVAVHHHHYRQQSNPRQEVIAIQVDRVSPEDRLHVEVGERTDARVIVEKHQKKCHCEICKDKKRRKKRKQLHGRVPVGEREYRYGQGVVIIPSGRTPSY